MLVFLYCMLMYVSWVQLIAERGCFPLRFPRLLISILQYRIYERCISLSHTKIEIKISEFSSRPNYSLKSDILHNTEIITKKNIKQIHESENL